MVAAAAVLALLGAGCLGTPRAGGDSNPAPPFAELETVYSASDFPPDADWIVLRVESAGKLPDPRLQAEIISHEASATSPTKSLDHYKHPCMVVEGFSSAGRGSGVTGLNVGIYQGVRYHGALGDNNVSGVSNVYDSDNLDLALPWANQSVEQGYFLVGLNTVHDQGPREYVNLTLTSEVPFRSSIIASGTMDCVTQPEEFQEGNFTQVAVTLGSGYFEATGLRSSLEAGGPAYLAVFAQANQALVDSVSVNGSVVWHQDSAVAPVDDFSEWWIDQSSRWEFRIDEARDLNGFPATAYVFVNGLPSELAPMLPAGAPPPRTAP